MFVINDITKTKSLVKWIYDYRLDKSLDYLKDKDPLIIDIFKTFYYNLDDYSPDISGYTLFFLVPPHLSSPEFTGFVGTPNSLTGFFSYLNTAIPFLATEVNVPSIQVKVSEYNMRKGSIPIADEVAPTGDLTVRYIDTKYLHVYSLHSIWVKYIDEVQKGIIKPGNYISSKPYVNPSVVGTSSDYIADGNIDYMTCAFVLKFTPDFRLTYFARLTGIFPNALTPQDIIGNRTSPELTIVNISYVCAFINEFTYPELEAAGITLENPGPNIFLRDFKNKLSNFLKRF